VQVSAYNHYVVAFDNISTIRPDQSDLLCRLSTGLGYSKRALRTDAELFQAKLCRPVLLNGIPDDLAKRGDLANRSIVVELPVLDEAKQRSEEEFWAAFEEVRPRVLGALFDAVAGALASRRKIDLSGRGRIRMDSFARWAEAGCRALGFAEGEFLDAFILNQERAMRIAFNQDPVAQAVALFMDSYGDCWRGNTKPLYEALCNFVRKKRRDLADDKRWPTNAVWLGRQLRRSAALLRKVADIEIAFGADLRKTDDGDKDGLEIRRRPEA
jgi:putative DNA primase/helicase